MKLKKSFLITSIVLAIILCFSIGANAETVASGTCGDYANAGGKDSVTWTLDDTGLLTISGTGIMEDYSSYSSVPWYDLRYSIETAVIEDGVTSIGDYAFYGYSNLVSVTISKTITHIGDKAFEYCPNLKKVYISDLEAWCNINFNNNTSNPLHSSAVLYINNKITKSITIPETVTVIKDYTFYGCSNLTSITIPAGATSIGAYAFNGLSSLESIHIPDSITSIGRDAFNGCGNLKNIYISDIKKWCKIDFYNQSSNPLNNDGMLFINNEVTENLIIPYGITDIKKKTFCGCASLVNITIPSSVKSIGNSAFEDCVNLTNVKIDYGIEVIDDYSFFGCATLEKISLPDSLTKIGLYAFGHCDSLESLRIPQGVIEICESTFFHCYHLNNIFIPASVKIIDYYAFNECVSLENIHYQGSEDDWKNIDVKDIGNTFVLNSKFFYNVNSVLSNAQVTKTAENLYTYSFNMNAYEPVAGTFIVALYNGNKLVGIANEDLSVANTTYTATDKPITTSGEATSYKIFFWSSLDGMVPLCSSIDGIIN